MAEILRSVPVTRLTPVYSRVQDCGPRVSSSYLGSGLSRSITDGTHASGAETKSFNETKAVPFFDK